MSNNNSTSNTTSEQAGASAAPPVVNPRDPSGFLNVDNGNGNGNQESIVKIIGTARDDLNGLLGFCTAYNRDRERYMVRMANVDSANAPNATVMALKPTNLVQASKLEGYKAQFQQLVTDPRLRQRLAYYYEYANGKCRPFQLEHVVGVATLLLGLGLYFVGVTKTLMAVSATLMIGLILVEDVVRHRKPWRQVVQNFPSRSKMVLEKQFPFVRGKLSEPVAAGIVGVLLALTIQSVVFTNNNSNKATTTTTTDSSSTTTTTMPSRPVLSSSSMSSMTNNKNNRDELEKYYNLGFEDSLDGKDRGHSFAREIQRLLEEEASAASANADDLLLEPIAYSPSPLTAPTTSTQSSSSFLSRLLSMRTAGSLFYLYRSAMQIGVDPSTGIFSIAQMAANIQHAMPAWQKGMLAFSCYNLISNLFF